jgi:hypothetical protein
LRSTTQVSIRVLSSTSRFNSQRLSFFLKKKNKQTPPVWRGVEGHTRLDIFDLEWGTVKRIRGVTEEMGLNSLAVDTGFAGGQDDGVLHEREHERVYFPRD